jgi:mannosidase alpha-like ER degradation enhancer 1
LRFYLDTTAPKFQVQGGIIESPPEILITAYTSLFGADLTALPLAEAEPARFGHGQGVRVIRDKANASGCLPYDRTFDNDVVLVHRGGCTFLEKLVRAKSAGASGVVVISGDELAFNPSCDPEEMAAAGDLGDVALLALKRSAGTLVVSMLDVADAHGVGVVVLAVDSEGQTATNNGRRLPDAIGKRSHEHPSRVLYINGHALLNTRLLV